MRYTKSKLENLPNSLQKLNCGGNSITKLENLPNSLQELYCYNNSITKLENLPNCLQDIWYDKNKITMVDNISIDWFHEGKRNGFSLKFYNTIKRLQRRHRIRFRLKNKAARIIQNGCHNWL